MYINGFRQGSGSAGFNVGSVFYAAGNVSAAAATTLAVTSHLLYAAPFFSPRAGAVDRLVVSVTGAVASTFGRIAIYAIDDFVNFYPKGLVLVCSRATTAAGLQAQAIVASLNPGTLYWFAFVSNGNPTLRAIDKDNAYPIFGYDQDSAYPRILLCASIDASSVPQTFPVSASVVGSDFPMIGVRYVSFVN